MYIWDQNGGRSSSFVKTNNEIYKNTNMDVGNTLYSISNIFEIKNGNWSRGHGQRDQRIKRRRRRRRRRRKNQR